MRLSFGRLIDPDQWAAAGIKKRPDWLANPDVSIALAHLDHDEV